MPITDQLSVITDEIDQDFEYVLDIAQQYGIKDVEVRKVWDKNIAVFDDDELLKMKKALEEREMGISMVSGPFAKTVLPGSKYEKKSGESFDRNTMYNLSFFDRLVEIAHFLDTPNIRIFNFFTIGVELNDESWNLMIETLRPYVKKAEEEGIVLMVENEHVCFLDTLEHTTRFFQEMNSPAIKLNLDPGNYYSAKQPTDTGAYRPFYENDWVGYMHVKDPKFRLPFLGGKFTTVGQGKIDYNSLFQQALEYDYNGYFSLETHVLLKKEQTSVKSLDYLKSLLEEIGR